MTQATVHESYPDPHHDSYEKTIFGFWCYLLSDFVMFATFFAAYAVLRKSTFGGPSAGELFNISAAFSLTIISLCAAFASGLGGIAAYRKSRGGAIFWFIVTFLLGIFFIGLEFCGWAQLVQAGHSWSTNAFLSAYFTLVGMHAAHMCVGLLWIIVLLVPLFFQGVTDTSLKRLTCLRMFWQFINIVWLFIFAMVYLIGGA